MTRYAHKATRGADRFWYTLAFYIGSLQAWCLRRVRRPVWRTFDGKVLLPEDFGDVHLVNTIKMLLRNAEQPAMVAVLCAEATRRGLRT